MSIKLIVKWRLCDSWIHSNLGVPLDKLKQSMKIILLKYWNHILTFQLSPKQNVADLTTRAPFRLEFFGWLVHRSCSRSHYLFTCLWSCIKEEYLCYMTCASILFDILTCSRQKTTVTCSCVNTFIGFYIFSLLNPVSLCWLVYSNALKSTDLWNGPHACRAVKYLGHIFSFFSNKRVLTSRSRLYIVSAWEFG